MSEFDCYYDAQGCLVCPEVPAIVGVPAYASYQPVIGWNAGANSLTELDGDMHTVFTQPLGVTGVVIGFRSGRARNTMPALIEHGFYFQAAGNFNVYQVIEAGQVKTAMVERAEADSFEIRRKGGRVTYWVNDTLVHVSAVPSYGTKVVNCCLYTSGDTAPAGAAGPTPPGPSYLNAPGTHYTYLDIYAADPTTYPDSQNADSFTLAAGPTYTVTAYGLIQDNDGCGQGTGVVPSDIAWWPSDFQANYGNVGTPGAVGIIYQATGVSFPIQMNQTFHANGAGAVTADILPEQAICTDKGDATAGNLASAALYVKIEGSDGSVYYGHTIWNNCF